MDRAHTPKKRFDFDIGYLVKSPCRDCMTRFQFPACMEVCRVLDRVQRKLARGVSSTRSPSLLESYAVLMETRNGS
jgi:hypothetical protein